MYLSLSLHSIFNSTFSMALSHGNLDIVHLLKWTWMSFFLGKVGYTTYRFLGENKQAYILHKVQNLYTLGFHPNKEDRYAF